VGGPPKRESHKQALRQLLQRYGLEGDWDPMIEEILRVSERFAETPRWLDEALNSGDGTYKP
jgi:hypothetical protein